jgi:hypothetical protein
MQVRSIVSRTGAWSSEIAIVVDRNAGATENPNRGDFVSVVTQGFTLLAPAQAEKAAAKAGFFIKACSAAFPAAAAPIPSRRPGGVGLGFPPAARISVITITITIVTPAGADDEDCATALLNP